MNTWKAYLTRYLGDYIVFGVLTTVVWLGAALFVRKIHIVSHVALIASFIAMAVCMAKIWALTNRRSNQIFLRPVSLAVLIVMFSWGITTISWQMLSVVLTTVFLVPVNLILSLVICWFVYELRPIEKKTP